jgi:hypothetical protein
MAVNRANLDDHPLLTARHVDNLTQAVHTLVRVITQANGLMQQGIRLLIQRGAAPDPTPSPASAAPASQDSSDPPALPLVPHPTSSSRAAASNRATGSPQRRRAPR